MLVVEVVEGAVLLDCGAEVLGAVDIIACPDASRCSGDSAEERDARR
jgi:hypothetical protein